MSSRLLLLASSIVLTLLVPLRQVEGQQAGRLLSATGVVTVRARVAARIEPRLLAIESVSPEGNATTIVTRLEVGANVPHVVRARVSAAPGAPIEVRDAAGQWARLSAGASMVVASGDRAGVAEHRFACRVSGRADACPVVLEVVSVDPEFPLQVSVGGPAVPGEVRVAAGAAY